jgi:CubicO group peptidase (beta-lactamase class C family)
MNATASAHRAPLETSLAETVQRVFADWQRPDRPGGWAVVLHRGQPLIERSFGTPSIEHGLHWRQDSRFHIFGVTMTFTAIATLALIDEGVLAFDDDVRRYVPELPDYGNPILVRHLLTHTSGLRDSESIAFVAGFVQRSPCSMNYALELMQRQRHLNFVPGNELQLSNSNFRLLAIVLERATGQGFDRLMHERLFAPLGMGDTAVVPIDGPVLPHLATGYTLTEDGRVLNLHVAVASAGDRGIVSSVRDMVGWLKALRTWQSAGEPLVERLCRRPTLSDGSLSGHGLGVRVGQQHGVCFMGMGGEHYGYCCEYLIFPEDDLAVLLCSNYSDARLEHRAHDVAESALASIGSTRLHGRKGRADRSSLVGWYANPALPLVVSVALPTAYEFGTELHLSAGHGGVAEVEDGSFASINGYHSVRASFMERIGRRPTLELTMRGDRFKFEPVAAEFLSTERMRDYVGLYGCSELNAVHRVYVQDGHLLHLRGLGDWPQEQVRELVMVGEDLFALDYPDRLADLFTTIKFVRSRNGRVTRMVVANRDVSGIEMDRLPDSVAATTGSAAALPAERSARAGANGR